VPAGDGGDQFGTGGDCGESGGWLRCMKRKKEKHNAEFAEK